MVLNLNTRPYVWANESKSVLKRKVNVVEYEYEAAGQASQRLADHLPAA